MRRLLSLLTIIFCSLGISNTMAQEEREYVPFVEEGKAWYCSSKSYVGPITSEHPEGEGVDCIFTMCGDTLVNDREYKKVYCQFEDYYGDKEQHYYCAVREDAYRVFIIEEEETEENLIYDFCNPKEFVTLTYYDFPFVRTDGWHLYGFPTDQLIYAVCQFTDDGEVDYSNDPCFWVDGVGNIGHNPFAFEFNFLPYDEPKLGKSTYVRTCMKDGEYIYSMEWTSVPIDDPEAIDKSIYTNNSPKGPRLYDLQGRRLQHTPAKGVYIQDGKKYIK